MLPPPLYKCTKAWQHPASNMTGSLHLNEESHALRGGGKLWPISEEKGADVRGPRDRTRRRTRASPNSGTPPARSRQ